MGSPSPLRLVSSFLLQGTSWPLERYFYWRKARNIKKTRAVWLEMSHQNIEQWSVEHSFWTAFEHLANEPELRTVVLDIRVLPKGWARIDSVYQTLKRIKDSGKTIFILLQIYLLA